MQRTRGCREWAYNNGSPKHTIEAFLKLLVQFLLSLQYRCGVRALLAPTVRVAVAFSEQALVIFRFFICTLQLLLSPRELGRRQVANPF